MDIQQYIFEVYQAEFRLIEKTLEEAIQGGKHGVKIIRSRYARIISVEVDPEVPYGFIYEYLEDG